MGWSGGRLRRDTLRFCWDDFLSACCLSIDSVTLQLQTFLADRARYRDDLGSVPVLFLGARATHANAAVEWVAANMMAELASVKLAFGSSKFDYVFENAAAFVGRSMKWAGERLEATKLQSLGSLLPWHEFK